MIHFANVKRSPRLQRFLACLKRAKCGKTTRELQTLTGSCNPHTDAAELRRQGYPIACRFERTTEDGARIYRYTLEAG